MAESKRIFAKGRMNRDIDDRLLPEGEYRDALNVNVGKSEGGDIGAVENLKGNMEIPNQTGISGTTIGVVRDPNEDRIYWFNTSATADGIYEYDQSTGEVNTLVQDIKRDVPLPTCAPTITIAAIEPDSRTPNRPGLPGLPAVPTGVCTDPAASNTGVASDATRTFQDDSLCTFPPVWTCDSENSGTCSQHADGRTGFTNETDCENSDFCRDTSGGGGGGGGSVIQHASADCPGTAPTNMAIPLSMGYNGAAGVSVSLTVSGDDGTTYTADGTSSDTLVVNVTSAAEGDVVYTFTTVRNDNGSNVLFPRTCTVTFEDGAPPPPTPMYECNADGLCVRNDASGTSTAPDCGGICVPPPTGSISECQSTVFINVDGSSQVVYSYIACPLSAFTAASVCGVISGTMDQTFGGRCNFCIISNPDDSCSSGAGSLTNSQPATLTRIVSSTVMEDRNNNIQFGSTNVDSNGRCDPFPTGCQ